MRRNILEVPYRRQETKITCSHASLRMVLEYHGTTMTEQQILSKMPIRYEGSELRRLEGIKKLSRKELRKVNIPTYFEMGSFLNGVNEKEGTAYKVKFLFGNSNKVSEFSRFSASLRFRGMGHECDFFETPISLTKPDLRRFIDSDLPLIAFNHANNHAVVIRGYDGKAPIANDPAPLDDEYVPGSLLSAKEFEKVVVIRPN